MKLNYPPSHYNPSYRSQLFPLSKAFIKSSSFTDEQRKAMYQISEKEVDFVENLNDADLCILTMSWNYYIEKDLVDEARQYILEANAKGKQVWTWMSGDFGVDLKFEANYKVFRMSGHRSQLPSYHIGMPVFINDPLQKYVQTNKIIFPKFTKKPIVGFCGQADASLSKSIKEIGIRLRHWFAFKLNTTKATPQPIQSTSRLRANLLNRLERSSNIASNFIKRKKYRAGIQHNKSKHQTTQEFYDNIKESQYVLCARGGGNFSVRFYETLAMGRIPVFVDTDCLLPFHDEIDWKQHCVWVDFKDRKEISQKVKAFHEYHTEESLVSLMQANRKLWEEQLRIGRFFSTYYRIYHFNNNI